MPARRTAPTAPAKRARAKAKVKKPASAKKPQPSTLTPLQQAFQDKLRLCLPQEREFVKYKLQRLNNTEAAVKARYSARTAEEQGARLLGRVRVRDAYEAGLRAAGFGALDLLDDISALRNFDRSQIEREVQVKGVQIVTRPAEQVIQELITRERAVAEFKTGLERADEATLKKVEGRLRALLLQRLELEEQVAINPDAVVHEEREVLITKRVIDYDLARERGLLRFIKGVKPTLHGDLIETYDWMDGVEMGAKAVGLYKLLHEHTGKDGGPIDIEAQLKDLASLTGAPLMAKYQELLGRDDE